ncbi:MAG: FISUMP domain-containing protein [bacterium]
MYLKKTLYVIIIIVLFIGQVSCKKESTTEPIDTRLKGSYVGQVPPGLTPKIFAPEFICLSDAKEWSCSFSPDGNEIYFYRIADDWYCKIYCSKQISGVWTTPEEVNFSKGFTAAQPHVMLDNTTLYFAWNVGSAGDLPGKEPGNYSVTRTDTGWSTPSYSGDGMYFTSSLDGQLYTTDMSSVNVNGKTYLAKVTVIDRRFTAYERLNIQAGYGKQAHPCISPDGSYILFDVEGGYHMFVSFKNPDGTWGDAIDLVNNGFDLNAGGAYISPDGKYLFYHLNDDIYWVSTDIILNLKNLSLFTDVDGNVYKVKKINNKYWMTENFKATKKADGINLQGVYVYDNNNINAANYGRLYTWPAALDATPEGWHLPTQTEWEELIASLGGANSAGGKLKETGVTHWNSPNSFASNSSGFSAVGGGFRGGDGVYYELGGHGSYWGSANNAQDPYCVYLYNTSAQVTTEVSPIDKTSGIAFAVRYVKN